MLFDLSGKLRLLLPDISFDAPDISPIKYNPMNPLFLIAKLLFMPAGKNCQTKKRGLPLNFISLLGMILELWCLMMSKVMMSFLLLIVAVT